MNRFLKILPWLTVIAALVAMYFFYLANKDKDAEMAKLRPQAEEISQLQKHHPGAKPTIVISLDRRVEYGSFLRLFSIAQETGQKIRLVYRPDENQSTDYF